MLTGLLIILILFAALVYSGKVARPAWAQTSPMTLSEFADKRQTLRTLTNTIRERKCKPPVHSFKTPAWKVKHRVWNLSYWRGHLKNARALKSACAQAHHTSLWLCVHNHEGAWNDPNPPYWGGLQMGQWFHDTYGGELYRTKGYANNWTPAEQMAVADRAYHGAGHKSAWLNNQWPGTLSECGA